MFSLWIDYPSKEEEERIVATTTEDFEAQVQQVYTREQVMAFQHLVRRIPASRHTVNYAVSIARATRPNDPESGAFAQQYVEWGAGPRASQHMILAAKALAVLDAQPTVSAEHIREVAPFVLRHRVLPNYNAAGDGISAAKIIEHILQRTEEPVYSM